MKEMIINEGTKYFYQTASGERSSISSKRAWAIFTGWKEAGRKICRKYGMGGRVTWVWPE